MLLVRLGSLLLFLWLFKASHAQARGMFPPAPCASNPQVHPKIYNPTPEIFEELGLTEEEAQMLDDFNEKLAAFHRLRKYGYSYRFDPNDQAQQPAYSSASI
jgi:hypothetical protein